MVINHRQTKTAAVIITIILLIVLVSHIQLADIINTLNSIDPWYILLGLILYALSSFFRAVRFYFLLNREIELRKLFSIICIHNMVNNIMPARTGELSYIYLLKKHCNKKDGDCIATLIIARVFDLISISLMFFVSVFLVRDLPEIVTKSLYGIFLFFILISLFLLALLKMGDTFLNAIRIFFVRFKLENMRVVKYSLLKGGECSQSFKNIQSQRKLYLILLLSILILTLNYILIFILLRSMNIYLPFQIVVIGATFMLLTTVLPIYGIGGFGTTEGVWTLVFVPLGLSLEAAIISGFSYHIIIWVYFLILGMYGSISIYANESLKQ